MKNIYNLIGILCIAFVIKAQDTFDAKLQSWSDDPTLKGSSFSYSFYDIQNEQPLATYNEHKKLVPASTLKFLTAMCMLEKERSSFNFETKLYYSGKIGDDGSLYGDVILYGNGDPSFGSDRFGDNYSIQNILSKIVSSIKKKGIKCIDGSIVVDASFYGDDCTPGSWQFEDIGNYYAAGCWSVNVEENQYTLSLNSASEDEEVYIEKTHSDMPYFSFENNLKKGSMSSGDNAYIYCAPYQYQGILRGSIPKGRKGFKIKGSLPNAPYHMAWLIKQSLEDIGIYVDDAYVSFHSQQKSNLLCVFPSPNLHMLVKENLHHSINLYSESFLKYMGKGERKNGLNTVNEYSKRKNIVKKNMRIVDGSGLSKNNLLSSEDLMRFLRYQYTQRPKKLKEYLPQSGKTGTLKNYFNNDLLKHKVFAKSGSMDGILNFVGILETKKGNNILFVVMINNYTEGFYKTYNHISDLLKIIYLAK